MPAKVRFIDRDRGWNEITKEIKKARSKPHAVVGVFGSKAAADHGGLPNIHIAVTHEFGLTINHPGGTHYFVGEDGRARFVSKEEGAKRGLPVTKPHTIQMPERSFLRGTIDVKQREIIRFAKNLFQRVITNQLDTKKALDMLGVFVQGEIRKRMSMGIPPALKPATIRRKGSSTPLIDTGQLRASIDFQTRNI